MSLNGQRGFNYKKDIFYSLITHFIGAAYPKNTTNLWSPHIKSSIIKSSIANTNTYRFVDDKRLGPLLRSLLLQDLLAKCRHCCSRCLSSVLGRDVAYYQRISCLQTAHFLLQFCFWYGLSSFTSVLEGFGRSLVSG